MDELTNKIIEYIKSAYDPSVIIVYGSYADGSNNLNSDFDALVLSPTHEKFHDTSTVNSVTMDIFVYPEKHFEGDLSCEDFPQLADGIIVLDTEDKGLNLKNKIIAYLENKPHKTKAEIKDNISWCVKMLQRANRQDAEGYFRWHWVLIDSLEMFCDAVEHNYKGPKKALSWMEKEFPQAFSLYNKALTSLDYDHLTNWIDYLSNII